MIGRGELVVIVVVGMYLIFAYQLSHLLRDGRWGTFLLRLMLSPIILLFDWPIRRRRWRDGE